MLSYNLSVDGVLGELKIKDAVQSLLLNYSTMIPEIARLAREAFYRYNVFRISPMHLLATTLKYSAPSVNHLIRHLIFQTYLETHSWNHLSKLANNAYGFKNLRSVQIVVRYDLPAVNDWIRWGQKSIPYGNFNFKTKRELLFRPLQISLTIPPGMRQFLRSKISFKP